MVVLVLPMLWTIYVRVYPSVLGATSTVVTMGEIVASNFESALTVARFLTRRRQEDPHFAGLQVRREAPGCETLPSLVQRRVALDEKRGGQFNYQRRPGRPNRVMLEARRRYEEEYWRSVRG